MRFEFDKLKKNNIANFDKYMNVYNKFWNECRKMQQQFDEKKIMN